jgi:hypothetical protein
MQSQLVILSGVIQILQFNGYPSTKNFQNDEGELCDYILLNFLLPYSLQIFPAKR